MLASISRSIYSLSYSYFAFSRFFLYSFTSLARYLAFTYSSTSSSASEDARRMVSVEMTLNSSYPTSTSSSSSSKSPSDYLDAFNFPALARAFAALLLLEFISSRIFTISNICASILLFTSMRILSRFF